jgi:Tol biopolymer transport system component
MDLRDQLQTTLGDNITLERELGGGGMSRVFVAEEKSLGRKIVVKVLPPELAAGVSTERFRREIQVAARLQHPHIVPLLTAGETGGLPFYTMPFVKGESLRVRLTRGGELSVNEAVHILRDVAAALAYAHHEGVVHRDIKPENVIVSGGVAVVTDFGVSKAVDVAATEGGGGASTGLTSLGVALGTPAYMSPEQASADPHVDHRADVYSFGCVAYELLAGSSPFAGRPPHQMLAAHVTETPEPLSKRRPQTPPALAALVMRCLEKRPGDRPQEADELLKALDDIATTPSGGTSPTMERVAAVKKRAPLTAIAIAVVALLAAAYVAYERVTTVATYTPGAATPIAVSADLEYQPAISPDGKVVAYVSDTKDGSKIFARQIDGGRANLVTSELAGDQQMPRWSPDGSRLSFVAQDAIYVIPALTGGSPKRTIEGGLTHDWSRDGRYIAFARSGLWLHSMTDGSERQLVEGGQASVSGESIHSPAWSPDGRFISFVNGNPPRFFNLSATSIRTVPVAGGRVVRLSDSTHVNLSPVWTPDGKSVLYLSTRQNARDVYQQRVRADGTPIGAPTRVTTSLGSYGISLSADGTRMAYDVVRNNTNIWTVTIPPNGAATMSAAQQVTRENQHIESMALSNDGQWLTYDSDRSGNADIYKVRISGGAGMGEPVQLTTSATNEFAAHWSPDGKEIVFHTNREGTRDLYTMSAEGTGEQRVTSGPNEDFYPSWSPDGKQIVFTTGNNAIGWTNVATRGADGRWSAPRHVSSDSANGWASWSPAGVIAYNRRGFVMLASPKGGPAREIAKASALGGGSLQTHGWSGDGATLFVAALYPNRRGAIWAMPVRGGVPQRVLSDDAAHPFGRFDFTTDGKRLFFTIGQWESDVWVMELRR